MLHTVRDQLIDESGTRGESDVKRVKSVTLDRKLSSTARLPQRSTVVESPAGRMADENGQIVSARDSPLPPALQTPTGQGAISDTGGEPSPAATVDVIRPPFARNNTSVRIVNESGSADDQHVVDTLKMPSIDQEDDAITLGDIPLLADQTIRHQSPRDDRILLSSLNTLQGLIVKHFALLQLLKSPIGHVIDLDEVLELLESRKNQWWNKIFKGNQKKDQKKKGRFKCCHDKMTG